MKKIDGKTLVGLAMACAAGLIAFVGNIQDQAKERKFEEMDNRIKKLESKNESE